MKVRRPISLAGMLLTAAFFATACGSDRTDGGPGKEDAGTVADAAAALDASPPDAPSVSGFPRLDEVRTKSPHNAYARDETLFDQLFYHRARGLELDLHRAGDHEWDVYHLAVIDKKTSCNSLPECLRVIRTFHDAVPRHEVITIFLDMSDDFDATHTPADLDAALAIELGTLVYRPSDLVAHCPGAGTIRSAIQAPCGWPTLDELRGRILLGMTGSGADKVCQGGGALRAYTGSNAVDHPVFIAPLLSDTCTVTQYDAVDDVVFMNLDGDHVTSGPSLAARKILTRGFKGGFTTRGGFNDPESFAIAKASQVNFIATDLVSSDKDPFTKISTTTGFPFECIEGKVCASTLTEEGNFLGAKIVSGDLWNPADDGLFRHLSSPEAGGFSEWRVAVGSPNSNVEPFAKACLMARADASADAPYVGVCRAADGNRPRVQTRKTKGGATETSDIVFPAGYSDESGFVLKLLVTPGGGTTEVVASASIDGVLFTGSPKISMPMTLPLQGLAVSSHGSTSVKFLFASLTRKNGGATNVVDLASLSETPWGTAQGSFFKGLVP